MRSNRRNPWIKVLLLALIMLVSGPNTCGVAAAGGEPVDHSYADPDAVKGFLDEYLGQQMAELEVPGLAFVMVVDGEIVLAQGYGYADVEQGVPFDPDRTIVRAGSIVKTVAALAVMQLAEQGLIDLDADVNTYLTSFQVPDTYPEPVTARQLLHYTAGFDSRFVGIRAADESQLPPLREYLAEHMPPRTRPPGVVRAYNDHEIALAGLLVEEVSGMPYADYVRQHIFKPLAMSSSSMLLPEQDRDRTAVGYGSNSPYPANYYFFKNAPGAGFNTTATDMARYMLAHLDQGELDGQRVLGEDAMGELHTTRFRHHRSLPGIAYAFDETYWGDTRILAKNGGAPGFQNRMLLFPDQNMGIYFVYNRDSTVPLRQRLERAFLERFIRPDGGQSRNTNLPQTLGSTTAVEAQPGPYAGYYVNMNDYSDRSIEKVQQLFDQVQVKADGSGRLRLRGGTLVPAGPNLFRWDDGDDADASHPSVAFRENDRGRVTHFFEARTAFARLPWYEAFPVQAGLLAFALLVFLSGIVMWLVAAVRRNARPYALAGAISLLSLSFIVGLGVVMAPVFAGADPPWVFSFALPPVLLFLLALPLVVAALVAGLLVQIGFAWRNGWGTAWQRGYNAAVVGAGLAFLFFLHTWNLLGYRF